MSMPNQQSVNAESPDFRQKMTALADAMEAYKNMYWLGILLCWLVVPAIILLVRYVQYLIALNAVKESHRSENLKNGVLFLWIAFGISIGFGIIESTLQNWYVSFLSIAGYILSILAYMKLVEWSQELMANHNQQNIYAMKQGWDDIKMANILCIVLVGVFMIPGAFERTFSAIRIEFGSSAPSPVPMGTYSPAEPQVGYAPAPQAYVAPASAPAPVSNYAPKPKFCGTCGEQIKDASVKFCPGCGSPI